MNHDDELFHRAVAHWRETDGRYIPPPLMNLALERARILRAARHVISSGAWSVGDANGAWRD